MNTQLHTLPLTAAALALCLIVAYLSDRTGFRSPFNAFGLALTIADLATLTTIHYDFSTQYAGLFLIAMSACSVESVIVCWYVMNLTGDVDRSVSTAWTISFGNIGGIVSTFTFLAKDVPSIILATPLSWRLCVWGVSPRLCMQFVL